MDEHVSKNLVHAQAKLDALDDERLFGIGAARRRAVSLNHVACARVPRSSSELVGGSGIERRRDIEVDRDVRNIDGDLPDDLSAVEDVAVIAIATVGAVPRVRSEHHRRADYDLVGLVLRDDHARGVALGNGWRGGHIVGRASSEDALAIFGSVLEQEHRLHVPVIGGDLERGACGGRLHERNTDVVAHAARFHGRTAHAARLAVRIDRQGVFRIKHIGTLRPVGKQRGGLALHARLARIRDGEVHCVVGLGLKRVENGRQNPCVILAAKTAIAVDRRDIGHAVGIHAAVHLEEEKRAVSDVRVYRRATDDARLRVGDASVRACLRAGSRAAFRNADAIILSIAHLCEPCGDARVRIASNFLIKNGDRRSPHRFERDCHALKRLVVRNMRLRHA